MIGGSVILVQCDRAFLGLVANRPRPPGLLALEAGCAQFVLDTGVANAGPQRVYRRQGQAIPAIGFGRRITLQYTTA